VGSPLYTEGESSHKQVDEKQHHYIESLGCAVVGLRAVRPRVFRAFLFYLVVVMKVVKSRKYIFYLNIQQRSFSSVILTI
jgi:hypothetical protein